MLGAFTAFLLAGTPGRTAASGTGAVCVGIARMPSKVSGQEAGDSVRGYTVQIDSLDTVIASAQEPTGYGALELGRKHLVRIRRPGRMVQSFYFTFESATTDDYCLFLEPYYSTWQLWPRSQKRDPCRCATGGQTRP
jgi:hypothetical protein